jgi:hypothetical protein
LTSRTYGHLLLGAKPRKLIRDICLCNYHHLPFQNFCVRIDAISINEYRLKQKL